MLKISKKITYTINPPCEINKIDSITCHRCNHTSFHPKDVKDLWCNICDKNHVRVQLPMKQ